MECPLDFGVPNLDLSWLQGLSVEEVVVPLISFKVEKDAELDAVVLLVEFPVGLDPNLSVHKHQVFKLTVQHVVVPLTTSLLLILVLNGRMLVDRWWSLAFQHNLLCGWSRHIFFILPLVLYFLCWGRLQ
jgi:hypothetical protein